MESMTLSRALRYKKRLVERIGKVEKDIQSANSYRVENTPEVDVQASLAQRTELVAQLVSLKLKLQAATAPIMETILNLAEKKAEISFWQSVDTKRGIHQDQWGDSPAVEYDSTFSRNFVDERIFEIQNEIDQLQTQIDAHNASTEVQGLKPLVELI